MIFVYKFKSEDYHDWLVMSAVEQSKEVLKWMPPFCFSSFWKKLPKGNNHQIQNYCLRKISRLIAYSTFTYFEGILYNLKERKKSLLPIMDK